LDQFQDAMLGVLRRDIANFGQGIEMMESRKLKTGESAGGQITDTTNEMLEFYRRTITDLKRALASLESKGL
jgi:hypothetical protein